MRRHRSAQRTIRRRPRSLARAGAIGAFATLSLAALAPPAVAQSPGLTTLGSIAASGAQGDDGSFDGSLSGDGRFLVFSSHASNLVPGDTNGHTDVFLRDRLAQTTERVSVASDGGEASGGSRQSRITPDGRFVVFVSDAPDLVASDANGKADVFLHDRNDGTTVRLVEGLGGTAPDGDGSLPSISADGRFVAFTSEATNLSPVDGNGLPDVYVLDRTSGVVELVSVGFDGAVSDEGATFGVISGDGRYVAYESTSRNINLPPRLAWGPGSQIFRRDRLTGTTIHVSKRSNRWRPGASSWAPSISHDGRFLAFASRVHDIAPGLVLSRNAHIYVKDFLTGAVEVIGEGRDGVDCGREDRAFACRTEDADHPSLSSDGRFLAFESRSHTLLPAALYGGPQIYVLDRTTRLLRRVSVDPGAAMGSSCSTEPVLSPDGAVVTYRTTSEELVANDVNQAADVLVSEWTCAPSGEYPAADALPRACRAAPPCPAVPASSCASARGSTLRIHTRAPGSARDPSSLRWSWNGGSATLADLGDPSDATDYTLCVYAGATSALQLALPIPAGDEWRRIPRGFRLRGRDAAVHGAILRAGFGSSIRIDGAGSRLGLPYLALDESGPISVRLHRSDGGCFGADLPASSIRHNEPGLRRTAAPDRPGRFLARLP